MHSNTARLFYLALKLIRSEMGFVPDFVIDLQSPWANHVSPLYICQMEIIVFSYLCKAL